VTKWLETAPQRPWWQWLLAATAAGFVSGLILALLGVFAVQAIHDYLAHDKLTEWGDALLAIYAFLTFAATGFVAAFSGIYGALRRSRYLPLSITCVTLAINVIGFFVPTGGYAMLPFYASVVTGVSLTIGFLGRERRKPIAVRTAPAGPKSEV
jgi:O-antigen/teichoic acid export membrane protein